MNASRTPAGTAPQDLQGTQPGRPRLPALRATFPHRSRRRSRGRLLSALSRREMDGLVWMREEEKHARDVYRALGELYALPAFVTIEEVAIADLRAHPSTVPDMALVFGTLERLGEPPPRLDALLRSVTGTCHRARDGGGRPIGLARYEHRAPGARTVL